MTDLSSPARSLFSEQQMLALAGGSSKELQRFTEQSGGLHETSALGLFLRGRITLPQVVGLLGLSGQGIAIYVTTYPHLRTPHISVSMGSNPSSPTQSDE